MLTIEQCRQLLGEKEKHYSDEQLLELRATLYGMAYSLIDKFKKEPKKRAVILRQLSHTKT
jgi:hypothetical protein